MAIDHKMYNPDLMAGATETITETDISLSGNLTVAGTSGLATTTVSDTLNVTGVSTLAGGVTTVAGVVAKSGTAVPATAGAIAAGAPITCFSSNWKLWVTSDVPSHSATKGDLCINTGGSSTSTRLYVNNGTTNWVAITTAS